MTEEYYSSIKHLLDESGLRILKEARGNKVQLSTNLTEIENLDVRALHDVICRIISYWYTHYCDYASNTNNLDTVLFVMDGLRKTDFYEQSYQDTSLIMTDDDTNFIESV